MNEGQFRKKMDEYRSSLRSKASVIAVASGKGGVGKTFFTTNLAKYLESEGQRVLIIDCDVYLSNCYLHFGVTPEKDIFDLINGDDIAKCITNVGGIDLISGRSGDEFNKNIDYVKTILGVTQSLEFKYDYILLDCPAGIDSKILSLMTYCDERLVILNPNKYSLTDGYSLIKTLRLHYGVKEFSLIVNKCDSINECSHFSRRIDNTCMSFLPDVKVQMLGRLPTIINRCREKDSSQEISKNLGNVVSLLNDKRKTGPIWLSHDLKTEFQVSF